MYVSNYVSGGFIQSEHNIWLEKVCQWHDQCINVEQ